MRVTLFTVSMFERTCHSGDCRKEEFRRKFQEFDADGNGFISLEEACSVLAKELGFNIERTVALVNEFDVNKDGRLSYDEFVGFYSKVKQK